VASRILLAERSKLLSSQVRSLLKGDDFDLVEASSPPAVASELSKKANLDLLIIDSTLAVRGDGLALAQDAIQSRSGLAVIMIASDSSEEFAIAALRARVKDYFRLPLDPDELSSSIRRHTTGARAHVFPTARPPDSPTCTEMVGESVAMREIRGYLMQVAATNSNALITGETGTGKELAAAMIHFCSKRRHRSFVNINCAAIPDGLLESELFGYERGAFTGAHGFKEGMLKLAEGGTVFFDEIGDMSPFAQAKILRAIEAREVRRLGGKTAVALDIRVIAATNRNLEHLVAQERFRSDLFFRLNVASIHLPPLRRRREDVESLCDFYIREMNGRTGHGVEGFAPETLLALVRYDWPGNVRELKNLVEAVFIGKPSRRISIADLPEQFRRRIAAAATPAQNERERILSALFATNWNKSRAAQKLSWSRMTLYRKMHKYRVEEDHKVALTY
jgi:DNA-binding NtrC family response regulator